MAEKKGGSKDRDERPVSPKVPVLNTDNETVREIQLSPTVFAGRVNGHLVYEAVKQYRAGARRGTHKTKTRGEVAGSGRKPWRQKGTGRARVGEASTPLWRHGGTVFGPQPRDYSYSMPKKARAAALRSALAQRLQDVVDLLVRQLIEERPFALAVRGEFDDSPASVERVGPCLDEPIGGEAAEEPARVPGIEPQPRSQFTDRTTAPADLVEQADLAQRAVTSEEVLVERVDPLREQATELADTSGPHMMTLPDSGQRIFRPGAPNALR